jgi:hypothetical protein
VLPRQATTFSTLLFVAVIRRARHSTATTARRFTRWAFPQKITKILAADRLRWQVLEVVLFTMSNHG